jgi:hypothetical protein
VSAEPWTVTEEIPTEEIGDPLNIKGLRQLDVVPGRTPDGITAGQLRRWSYVSLEGHLALPASVTKSFDVAVRLGKIMRSDGSFDRLNTWKDAAAVEVRPVHRDRAMKLLGMKESRQWRRHREAWERVRMAHRCTDKPRGSLVLFLYPERKCPACGQDL